MRAFFWIAALHILCWKPGFAQEWVVGDEPPSAYRPLSDAIDDPSIIPLPSLDELADPASLFQRPLGNGKRSPATQPAPAQD